MRNLETNKNHFFEKSWCRFDYDSAITDWIEAALPEANNALQDRTNAHWLRCGGTWFAGVNVLANRADGSVADGPPLQGDAIDFIHRILKPRAFEWDRAQVSVCYPGYPKPMESESSASFVFRRDNDAAHVDGLLPEGEQRRRHLREYHSFILGIPMLAADQNASPLVVWEGSHHLVREALMQRFKDLAFEHWGEQDVTECYHRIRRRVFQQCRRVSIIANPGETYLLHRLAVHGIAPWGDSASQSRMICYLRPETIKTEAWLFDA